MKKYSFIPALLLCISVLVAAGCAGTKKQAPPPDSRPEADTTHLTAEDKGLSLSVSRQVRPLTALNRLAKQGYEIVSLQVALENNSQSNVPISPDFVTLKTVDGAEYKYSSGLTESITSRASFRKVVLPKDYRGGGLLIFEIRKGSKAETLTYKDSSGHNLTVRFLSENKTNI